MSRRKTLRDSIKRTSSLASADGLSLSNLLAGPMIGPSGPAPVPASRSPQSVKLEAWATSGTYGPLFIGSSPSAILQSSLENRLKARMDVNGSLEYALTWKTWDMPSGPPICALRASERRTGASASIGWPTPKANETTSQHRDVGGRRTHHSLTSAARLAGWQTPKTPTGGGGKRRGQRRGAV